MGMVESAMEFLRIARGEQYHNIVLSMKSSNPLVMVQAYRLLIETMTTEFGVCYPLHLGVTEAGDGEDGRIKSAIGIGTLLEDGIGDTIRVSLTEDPEFEIPVCQDLVKRYNSFQESVQLPSIEKLFYSPFEYKRRASFAVENIGEKQVPVVVSDLSRVDNIVHENLQSIGYSYDVDTDKWSIGDAAADYVYTGSKKIDFALPGTLKNIVWASVWDEKSESCFPIFELEEFAIAERKSNRINFVMVDCYSEIEENKSNVSAQEGKLLKVSSDNTVVFCLSSKNKNAMQSVRRMFVAFADLGIDNPVILTTDSSMHTPDEHLIHFATETGALLLDGMGDGICLGFTGEQGIDGAKVKGRTYLPVKDVYQFTNNTAFSILQATRTRISKTEYISCPSCGRTLFDLQETTAKIRSVTNHLKGVKIAIMGCIVNGPGEMADADFGYVGSGPGKITLYRSKEVVKKSVDSEVAVDELIQLLKDSGAWVEPS
jgi:(E)-4-hydroxy-3-methylbut-2-enyl-diphosphate synthase